MKSGAVLGSGQRVAIEGKTIRIDGTSYRGQFAPIPNSSGARLLGLRPTARSLTAAKPYQHRVLIAALGSFALLVLVGLLFGRPIVRTLGDFRRIASQAATDSLTGLGNRWTFDEELALEWRRAERVGDPLALILADIDDFKAINDTHGHQVGDKVLRVVGRVLSENVRQVDLAARYGGEEFAVIVPETDLEGAVQLAERLRVGAGEGADRAARRKPRHRHRELRRRGQGRSARRRGPRGRRRRDALRGEAGGQEPRRPRVAGCRGGRACATAGRAAPAPHLGQALAPGLGFACMRVSAKVDYAVRAGAELAAAAGEGPVKGERIAQSQQIPLKFLENILLELKHAGLVQSQRGAEGGYWLAQPPEEISLADVIRAVEGPIANVRGSRPEQVEYDGAAEHLRDVWIAVRANLRAVLETVTLADVAAGRLPDDVARIAADPEAWLPH